jgi:DNA/RNA-binding domain of Phe-tRNA-synthetase-like protein
VALAVTVEAPIRDGKVSAVLREEFPGLALRYTIVGAKPGRSSAGIKTHLRYLANRFYGQRALNLRREPITSAYRVFYRHIGLDPDEFRTPIEAAVLERLRSGGFKSQGVVDDALTIAIVETGVAMRAFDADRLTGQLALRIAQPAERLGGERDGLPLPEGTLVIADEQCAVAPIFGNAAPKLEVRRETRQVAVCAIQVQGVPDISVEEALWSCTGVLQGSLPQPG